MGVQELIPELKTLDGVPPAVADIYAKGDDGVYRPRIKADSGFSIEKVGPPELP